MRLFRKLLACEHDRLCAHLLRLAPEDRATRFWGSLSDAAIAGYCAKVDWQHDCVVGLFDAGVLRGVAELRFTDPASRTAEIAISVESAWQNHGVGFALLQRAVMIARNRNLESVHMICLLDNPRMRHLAGKLCQLHHRSGVVEADMNIPGPSLISFYDEMVSDGLGLIGIWLDPHPPPTG